MSPAEDKRTHTTTRVAWTYQKKNQTIEQRITKDVATVALEGMFSSAKEM
jgi:hypothetical protein